MRTYENNIINDPNTSVWLKEQLTGDLKDEISVDDVELLIYILSRVKNGRVSTWLKNQIINLHEDIIDSNVLIKDLRSLEHTLQIRSHVPK